MTDIRAELLVAYAAEHREQLAGMRAGLAEGEDEDIEEVYRHAHSLKGAARAVGFTLVEVLAHRLETLLQALWDDRIELDSNIRRTLARALDSIEDLSSAALAGDAATAIPPVMAELDNLLDIHGLEIPERPSMKIPDPITATLPVTTLRVDTEAAGRLVNAVGELLTQIGRHHRVNEELRRLHGEVLCLQSVCRRARHDPGDALESLLEKVCFHADQVVRGHDAVAETLTDMDWTLGCLANTLRDEAHHLRLVSADSLFGPYARMLREIAADQGKEVALEFVGLEARADRDVLQPLSEAVMHLLRNSVVHGIEPPAQRLEAGKPPAGRVGMTISAAGGRLSIRIEDDGKGLDLSSLARLAEERGMMPMNEAELQRLVFEPGLSTAGTVTAFAGRGMGMTIVRRVVDRLQGNITVEAGNGGIGTAFTITVPVTVMAQRVVLVQVRDQMFALPANALRRLAAIPRNSLVSAEGMTLAVVDGEQIRLTDLGALLGLAEPQSLAGGSLCVAVMAAGQARLGLVVDSFVEIRDLPVLVLEAPLADDAMLAGVVALDEGQLVLVLAPSVLLAIRNGGDLTAPSPPPEPPLVLVVDDSITTRTLEKSILEAHGYRVRLAVDGRQALEMLGELRPQVVVSDLEMPKLDGFGLLAAMKRNPDLRHIPVVLVTSRDSEADRERGLRLGADSYIVKTRFEQDDLLEAIGRLT